MQNNNCAANVIDVLLMRMHELNRFGDDDTAINNSRLLPLDVVVGKNGKFGLVVTVFRTVGFWRCQIIGQCQCTLDSTHTHTIRAINELEAVAARSALVKFWGQ